MNNYSDIINLPHHVSKKYKQMSLENRSAQFAPFAALTGFEDKINNNNKKHDNKILLSEEDKEILNMKLKKLLSIINSKPKVKITFYDDSERKYITIIDNIKKIDEVYKTVILNGKNINIDDIIDIDI